ncbi:type II toxin-antitoxin system VapC family toxin [Gloeocapsa sp. PCC 73106]|uniref:type II toxin-antitoxin system VapC family toxin n=1 Tax=Gloeocapsa sp. PCC 73106 TaxID=102232 RepID=UPI0002ACF8AD|nr:type II toxin-antitoxin system VapC family toxin [Gloeocapsa sp. PCC 73106]ELS00242.1 putative nucleic acid-binding protein [Gloeocapsa sp. PCC 73106]
MSFLTVCVDASLIVRLLTSNNFNSPYDKQWNKWLETNCSVVSPTLIYYEVTNAIYKYSKAGQITTAEATALLETALNLGIIVYDDGELHKQALEITQCYNLPATYDAHYLALAKRLNIELWTADQRLFNGVNSSLS